MAFGNMNTERGGRLGGVRPPLQKPPISQPVVPAPPATPPALPLAGRPGRGRPAGKPAPQPGAPRRNPSAAPDPTKDPLPPRFAQMVAGGMSEALARRKWTNSLTNRGKIGPGAGAPTPPGVKPPPVSPGGGTGTAPGGGAPAPSGPFVPGPSPAPGTPVFGGFDGGLPGGGGGGGAMPGGGGYGGAPGSGPGTPIAPGGQDFRDPMGSFLAAVPLMNINASKQIDSAMSQAGFGGNRWSTAAMNTAADIGSQNALAQNAMFTNALTDYANNQEDRAMQASGMGMQLGGMLDQQAQDRVRLPFEVGGWEQGRQDNLAGQYYSDFEKNKLGWLPMMLQAAQSQGSGSPGTVIPVQGEAPKPGAADYLKLFADLFG